MPSDERMYVVLEQVPLGKLALARLRDRGDVAPEVEATLEQLDELIYQQVATQFATNAQNAVRSVSKALAADTSLVERQAPRLVPISARQFQVWPLEVRT